MLISTTEVGDVYFLSGPFRAKSTTDDCATEHRLEEVEVCLGCFEPLVADWQHLGAHVKAGSFQVG